MQHNRKIERSSGFTLVELAVIVPILIVTALIIFDALFVLIRSSNVESAQVAGIYDVQNGLATIERDARLTASFLDTTDSSVTDPYKPTTNSGTWQYFGDSMTSTNRVLILRTYNTVNNPQSTGRTPAYLSELGCTPTTIYFNSVLTYDTIYFVKNNTLYRRAALDTTKPTCQAYYQKQSCPSLAYLATQGIGTRNGACGSDDEVVLTNVTGFSIQYYPTNSGTTPSTVYATGADTSLVTSAVSAEVTVTVSRKVSGESATYSNSLRISKLNTTPTTSQ